MTDGTTRPDGLRARCRDFFYAEEVPYGLALARILLPLVMLIAVIPRWPHARELFSSDGAPTPLWHSYGMPDLLPVPPGTLAVALYSALVFCLLAVSCGWMTRFALIVTTVLYAYFDMLDMLSSLTKYSVIATHAFFLLSLSQCGSVWSVDAWLRSRRGGNPGPRRFPVWPRRLLQLLIGVIYLGAAATKFHTPSFFSGDQLVYWMLTEVTAANPLGDYLSLYPAVVPFMAYATIIWEVAFIFVAWRGTGRAIMLSIGVAFHVLTFGMLGLIVFPLVYLALYMAWVSERDVDRLAAWSRRLRERWERPAGAVTSGLAVFRLPGGFRPGATQSAAAFALLFAATMAVGVEAEHHRDPFGIRAAGPRPQLQPMDPELVATLLRDDKRVRPEDMFFGFDLGSVTVGDIVADQKDTFTYGDEAIMQCHLVPPHEDLWVEFNLQDAEGRIIKRHGQIMPREYVRTGHAHRFTEELPPGEYAWVLRYQGTDISRRPFRLIGPAVQTAAALNAQ
jgi:hypothetical protein